MSEANNIISLPSESKIWYNTLYLASKIVCKKDENFLVLFEFDIELLYGRYPKGPFFNAKCKVQNAKLKFQFNFAPKPLTQRNFERQGVRQGAK